MSHVREFPSRLIRSSFDSVPAAGDLRHFGSHQLQHSSGQELVVGGPVTQLTPRAVAKRKQAAILSKTHNRFCFVSVVGFLEIHN